MKTTISQAEAQEALKSHAEVAEKLLSNKDDFEEFLQSVEKKMKSIPKFGDDLATVPAMVSLLKSFIEGKYKTVPYGSVVAIVSSLIYFISPIDFIPDTIPFVGHVDDSMVIKACLTLVQSDLEAYNKWRFED